MATPFDDIGTQFDGAYPFDGVVDLTVSVPTVGRGFISARDLLTPQTIITQSGTLWSREESERWVARLRRTPAEIKEIEEEETVALLMTLLVG